MSHNRKMGGSVVAFFVYMFGMMFCLGGVIEYIVRGESLGVIFKLCVGIAIIVIARQSFDFYNFQMVRLVKRYKERKRRKRQNKSIEETPQQNNA